MYALLFRWCGNPGMDVNIGGHTVVVCVQKCLMRSECCMCKNAVHCCLAAAEALGGGIGGGIGAVIVVLIAVATVIVIAFVVKKYHSKQASVHRVSGLEGLQV